MLTARGWVALVGGIAAYAVAVGFGARALVPLALALVIGPLVAVAIIRRHRHSHLRLTTSFTPARPTEGIAFTGAVRVDGEAPSGGTVLLEIGGQPVAATLRREADGGRIGSITVPGLPRGVHPIGSGALALRDPFGFARAERALSGTAAVIVWPSFDEPEATNVGVAGDGELGLRSRRAQVIGYDLHGIREHQHGESLRRVDWKTTARAGRLMVREMEDAARADAVIVVDLDATLLGADRAALDALLRAVATIVRGLGADGGQATLVLAGAEVQRIALDGGSGTWFAAMDALAAAKADRTATFAAAVLRDRSLLAGAAMTIVTASAASDLVALLAREAAYVPVRVVCTEAAAEAWAAAPTLDVRPALPATVAG